MEIVYVHKHFHQTLKWAREVCPLHPEFVMIVRKSLPTSALALVISFLYGLPVHAADRLETANQSDGNNVIVRPSQASYSVPGITDNEYLRSYAALAPVHAEYAYSQNITGAGVTVAVMDTGITATHPEFSGQGKLATGINAITGSSDVTDYVGHGTHVAGILAASRGGSGTLGVAFNAQILPVKVLADNGTGSTAYLDQGLRQVIGKAAIANMSLGVTQSYDPHVLQDAVRSGLLIVAAAGNERAANPNWPARFAKEAWANGQIIAVGAVDANNRIADFSNRAGDAAAWFLVAPGVNILSASLRGQYAYMSGTSMATPVVSGAAALLKQLWPKLSASQIANILFVTATDLGAAGIDPVYGRGLLNIEKALQPVGAVTTTTFNGKVINVLSGSLQPSSATSAIWSLASSGQLRVLAMDDFQRDFRIDLGTTVSRPEGLSLDQVFGNLATRLEIAERVLPNGSRLMAAYDHRISLPGVSMMDTDQAHDTGLAGFSFITRNANGNEAAFGMGGFAAHYFGAGGFHLAENQDLGLVDALANPYFSLVPGASHAAIAQKFGGFTFKLGMLSTGMSQALVSQPGSYLPPWSRTRLVRANSGLAELSAKFGDAAVSMGVSQTNEDDTYLGASSTGALSFGSGATTHSVQLTAAVLLTPTLTLAGQAAYGVTPHRYGTSLIAEVSEAKTNAFSMALIAADRIKRGDRLSLSVSQPMRTYSGEMVMDVLTSASDGTQGRDRLNFSMVPTGREIRTEVNYMTPIAKDASVGLTIMARRNPAHLADAPTEKLVATRYSLSF